MKRPVWVKIIFIAVILILIFSCQGDGNAEFYNSTDKISPAIKNAASAELAVVFLDIGQGDATLLTFPNKEQMLVDCGKDSGILTALGRVMTFHDNVIDYLVVTHPDVDHYGGCVDVMKRFQIKNIVYNGLEKKHDQFWLYFASTIEELKNKGVNYFEINKQLSMEIGGALANFIYPDHSIKEDPFVPGTTKKNDNNTSLVFSVKYGKEKVLMTGDMEVDLEKYLINKYPEQLAAAVLKVGHHGSDTSSSKDFLDYVHPRYASISSGKANTFGHPSRRTLRKLERIGAQILRTDEKSDILITVSGTTIKLMP